MYEVARTQQEIDDTLNEALIGENEGTKRALCSYEQGVREGIEWVLGLSDENPVLDEDK